MNEGRSALATRRKVLMTTLVSTRPAIQSGLRAVQMCRIPRLRQKTSGIRLRNTARQRRHGMPAVQVFGRHHDKILPVRVDKHGVMLTHPVRSGKRKVSSVIIFRKHHSKVFTVQTDNNVRILIKPKQDVHSEYMVFKEREYTVFTGENFIPLPLENIGHAIQYVYFVRNFGDAAAQAYVQIGPDADNLAEDLDGIYSIPARSSTVITPLRFSKYIRLLYRSAQQGECTKLFVSFQAQIIKTHK